MRVFLIQPANIVSEAWAKKVTPFLPLGLASIASALQQDGHQVKILDAYTEGWESRGRIRGHGNWVEIGLTEEEIAMRIRRFQPQVVGFSVPLTTQMPRLRSLARWVKAIHPEIFVICGGNHPSAVPHELLAIPDVDAVVLGEGEPTFPYVLRRLARGKGFTQIKGLAYRDQNGSPIIQPFRDYDEPLDSFPLPAYDLLPLKEYFKATGGRRMPFFTSRGCSNSCSFCSSRHVFGQKTRCWSTDYLVKHIRHLVEYYGVQELFIEDDGLVSDPPRAHAFFDALSGENLGIQWTARGGVDPGHLSEDLLAKIKRAGGRRIYFPPSSGSRRVLRSLLNKRLDLYRLEMAAKDSLRVGLKVSCQFILGSPGETLEEVYETLNFAWKLRSFGVDDVQFSLATPFVGTELRNRAEQLGCVLPLSEPAFTPFDGCVSTPDFSSEEIVRIRNSAESDFSGHGLIPGLSRLVSVGHSRRPRRVQEERFFPSLAPQPVRQSVRPERATRIDRETVTESN